MHGKIQDSWQYLAGSLFCLIFIIYSGFLMKEQYQIVCTAEEFYGEYQMALGLVRETVEKEIQCLPVRDMPLERCVYEDTFLQERTYGGDRQHYGTDLIDLKNEPGGLIVQSMTYGTITQKGWNQLGGWRVGITSPSGIYYYYAHLDSYAQNLEIGDSVVPGSLLGYMGDSGYGPEGTRGKFVVHLHLGIQAYPESEDEGWINPFPFLP